MSIFDRAGAVADRIVFDVMGDPIRITGGPYNEGPPVETDGVLTWLGADEANEFAHSTQPFIEYKKAAWTNPQRGDLIEFIDANGEPVTRWRIAKVRAQTNMVMTVDVTPA